MIGENFNYKNKQYSIVKLLGKGKSGYSYLMENGDEKFILKKIHDEPCEYYNFGDKVESELWAYNNLKTMGVKIPELYFYDKDEKYLVKEYIDGETALQVVIDHQINENIISQVFKMTSLVYKKDINIDYYPANFVISDGTVYYIDYEINDYSDEWNFENWGIYYWLNPIGLEHFLITGDESGLHMPGALQKPIKEPYKREAMKYIEKYSCIYSKV